MATKPRDLSVNTKNDFPASGLIGLENSFMPCPASLLIATGDDGKTTWNMLTTDPLCVRRAGCNRGDRSHTIVRAID